MTGDQQPFHPTSKLTERLDIDFALQAAGLGVWELDPLTLQVLLDDRCRELYGLKQGNQLSYKQLIQYIHPDDASRVDKAVQWAMTPESGGVYDETYRLIGVDNEAFRWVRFQGKGYFTEDGKLYRFAGVGQDVTQQVSAQQRIEASQQQLLTLFEQSPVGVAIIREENLTFEMANPFYGHLVGRQPDQIVGKPLLEALPELAGQGFDELLKNVISTGTPFIAQEVAVDLIRHDHLETIYVDLTYQPLRDEQHISGVLVVATDVTQQVRSRRAVEASETQLRSLVDSAPFPIGVYIGPQMQILLANQSIMDVWGKGNDVVGKSYKEILPELETQPIFAQIMQVLTTGQAFHARNQQVDIVVDGRLQSFYFNYSFTPLFDADGQVYGVMNTAAEVTDLIQAKQALEASETRLHSIIATAPAGMGLFVGRDLIVDLPNQTFINIVGKGPDIVGKPLREVMPELLTENQPFLQILDDVYTSGKMFQSFGSRVDIVQHGIMTHNYYNITYTPLRNDQGQVYAILDIAIDVTEEIKARQQLQEVEATLRGAIELADMGTWELDMISGLTTYSDRLKHLFEFTQDYIDREHLYNPIDEVDRARIMEAVAQASSPDSDGLLDEEYTVITQQTGRQRIVRAQGKVYFDDQGNPIKMVGSMRDITEERQTQLALEQLVQHRTEELAAVNEELAATNEEIAASNEEYAALNEELEEANGLLIRSNDNLQKFAYVASHDLQEPLRKIQQFGDLLKTRFDASTGEELVYIDRMQSAASRMSTLIRDLLDFSRISTQQDTSISVPLNAIVDQVLTTLELVIAETNTEVKVGLLPTVTGDASQLNQLFQNLIANAIKFRQPTTPPLIQINAYAVLATDLPPSVKPTRAVRTYYRIDIADNGVGFDEKYLDRIFQVFQRLHSKSEFAGTGIGLAICEKVVANHGGAITATSRPGQGTTFIVYLPT
ncbi:PAS domain-containing protein [Spirosoma validum]|uniref:histidine kinase n=1 Tax=Spirosoma validum TaxID=2771355 RepID=A0A927GBJ6_9BACT|nr:PAS domain-containing protein [Spirosoma validum]MBD2751659.1 PAS domain-containing protein [Spirosoma validum]